MAFADRRAHRADAAEEEVGDDRREVVVTEIAVGLQPREHPVHHAEEEHRQRLFQARRAQLRAGRRDRSGEGRDDPALGAQDAIALRRIQEADVFGQHAMLGLRAGVGGEEGRDQPAQTRLGRETSGLDFGHQREQPRDMRFGDLGEQLVLVTDVVIERRLRHAAGLSDLVHRRRGVAAPRKEPGRAREDGLALQLVAPGSSARHVSAARPPEGTDRPLGGQQAKRSVGASS